MLLLLSLRGKISNNVICVADDTKYAFDALEKIFLVKLEIQNEFI